MKARSISEHNQTPSMTTTNDLASISLAHPVSRSVGSPVRGADAVRCHARRRQGCDAMSALPSILWSGASDVGRIRRRNEDAWLVLDDPPLVIVADGMGGHRGGDVASRLATDAVRDHMMSVPGLSELPPVDISRALEAAILWANRVVLHAAERDRGLSGMGTTMVAGCFCRDALIFAHVGDSRLYRFSDGGLMRLTSDHTMLQEWLDSGMIAEADRQSFPSRGMLTRAVGVVSELQVTIGFALCRPGDRYLFCTDGLTDMLSDGDIESVLREAGEPSRIIEQLVMSANRAGGHDNITVVAAQLR